ncbi:MULTISPECIES: hypothetical protein [Pseudomonas]|uniref:Uncharacterized protein n=7 Tax=Pseudomonas syringae group TaxID=136849 RepID=A0A3M5F110_PSESS|nr:MULTISPECIES: hypothetical protein [Pseudomonas]EGH02996.1 hypothetical protein PSYAE_13752 [Pseudomonas amygdali pv. aesculi str. 0893_23]KPB18344.1 hypothetical protein AC519_3916 [Pseudomonas savastanoi]KPB27057.1 Uncharacterized protein AC516_0327 [Pseudomonas amygdali pv. sesami]KPB97561.1 Uncharacterized protein AC501_1044 [Pseudomonas amygdali pv. lachrymans]KPC18872.1 Uncharacterized protein AC499_2784 [Pseudomonas amygdali pv. lachrymans]
MKTPFASIAGSVLAQSAWKRVLFSLAVLILLWLAIGWSVAIP